MTPVVSPLETCAFSNHPSLCGPLVCGIYTEGTEIDFLILHTHHFSCACVVVGICMLFFFFLHVSTCVWVLHVQGNHHGSSKLLIEAGSQSNPELTDRMVTLAS